MFISKINNMVKWMNSPFLSPNTCLVAAIIGYWSNPIIIVIIAITCLLFSIMFIFRKEN